MANDDILRTRVYYERLHALLAQISETDPRDAERIGPGSGLPELVRMFNNLLGRAANVFGADPLVLEIVQEITPISELIDQRASSSRAHLNAKLGLIFSINSILQVLGARLNSAIGVPANVSIEREGLFVAGQRFDALLAATRILATAVRSIRLIDGYISDSVLNLLSTKGAAVYIQIITKAIALPGNIVPLAKAFNSQYGMAAPLSIRTSDAFHDRFLVIDDDHLYHFGASLKDLGGRGFMFSKIEEPSAVSLLRRTIDAEWHKATIVI